MKSEWFETEWVGKGTVLIRICWWRPAFWRLAYESIRAQGTGRPVSLYLACLLVWRFARS